VTNLDHPLNRLSNDLQDLGGPRRRVAEAVLANPSRVAHAPITWLAAEADTTPATVTRLATSLGYAGYPEFRAAIATDNGRELQVAWQSDIGEEISPTDDARQILEVLGQRQYRAMQNALDSLDIDLIESLADSIARARHIHVFGSWGDHVPAEELHIRLLRIGLASWLHQGESTVRIGGALLGTDDVVIVFSRTGENTDAEQFLERAKRNGAHAALITGAPRSTLGRAADAVIYTGSRTGSFWTDYFQGRTSDTLVSSLLWVLVSQRTPDTAPDPATGSTDQA
jgi:DNA-binding MurR/RpiR family transcriptional regulator